ncbi:hypothetical protein TL16_g00515 [Triparma laevis f. inornata]|uniref:Uncharacterized protein n=1 Tax=Triparma laevis f. inornata TaxID=1714386 RepID=A0A9W6ZG50_9STRA|nr:hypothetical protein TL16_g00515 [Triparma laevis f. inornata]
MDDLTLLESRQISDLQSYLSSSSTVQPLPTSNLLTNDNFYTSSKPYLPQPDTTYLPLYGGDITTTVSLRDVQMSSLRREVEILKESLEYTIKENNRLLRENNLNNTDNLRVHNCLDLEVKKREDVELVLQNLKDEFTRYKFKIIEDDTKNKQKLRDERRKDKGMLKIKDARIRKLEEKVESLERIIEGEKSDGKRLESVITNLRSSLSSDLEAKKSRLVTEMRQKMHEHALLTKKKYDETVRRLKEGWVKKEEVEERLDRVRREWEGVVELYRKERG